MLGCVVAEERPDLEEAKNQNKEIKNMLFFLKNNIKKDDRIKVSDDENENKLID